MMNRVTIRAIKQITNQTSINQSLTRCSHHHIRQTINQSNRYYSQKTARPISDMNRSELDQLISRKQSVNHSADEQVNELLKLRAQLQEQIRQEEYEANRPIIDRITERLSANQLGLKLLCFVFGFMSLAGSLELVRLSQTNKRSITDALVRYNQSSVAKPTALSSELEAIDQYLLYQSDNVSLTPEQREWIMQLRQTISQTIKQNSSSQHEQSLRQRAIELKQQLDAERKKQ
jgi:hypothetical protein